MTPPHPRRHRQHVRDFHSAAPPEFRLDARAAKPLAPLTRFLESYAGRVLIAADSPGRREVIVEMLGGARPPAARRRSAGRRSPPAMRASRSASPRT